jgi:flagellar basal-body rod protein FlgC
MDVTTFFNTFNISSQGLSAEKRRLSVTAENIANANTTRTTEGGPYRRKVLIQEVLDERRHFFDELKNAKLRLTRSDGGHFRNSNFHSSDMGSDGYTDIESKIEQVSEFKEVYDPGHPDANEEGVVFYPGINVVKEMLELISASRAYEANITMMSATKNLAKKSLEI